MIFETLEIILLVLLQFSQLVLIVTLANGAVCKFRKKNYLSGIFYSAFAVFLAVHVVAKLIIPFFI